MTLTGKLRLHAHILITITTLLICQNSQISGLVYNQNAIRWNKCAQQQDIFAMVHTATLDTCIEECLGQPDCVAVNYQRLHGACRLAHDGTNLLDDIYTCPRSIFLHRDNLDTGVTTDESEEDHVCMLDDLVTAYSDCEVLGNMVVPGSRVRLVCYIPSTHCVDNIFVCGQDGEWTLEKCLEEQIVVVVVNTIQASVPTPGYTNLVQNKPIQMSSVYSSVSPGSLLVDGSRSSSWPCACTSESTDPYMVVDMEQLYTITHMFLVNRGTCCPERLHDVRILLGPSMDNLREYVYIPGLFGLIGTVELFAPVTTRYVKITILGASEFLTICEFEAWNAAS